MPFLFKIELTGLCLFVKQPGGGTRLGVALPDGRRRTGGSMKHPDGARAIPHVGYLRLNAANLGAGVPAGDLMGTPPFEVVYRFDREELDIGVPEDGTGITGRMDIPDFDEFAPVKEVRPNLFTDRRPQGLLMRCVLPGGTVTTKTEPGDWRVSGELHPGGQDVVGAYSGLVTWERMMRGAGVTLTIGKFDGSGSIAIPLVPTALPNGQLAVIMKVANLCGMNPMEWDELEIREVREPDVDFKWLYQLLQLKPGEDPVRYPPSLLPHPHPILQPNQGILVDCFPGQITGGV